MIDWLHWVWKWGLTAALILTSIVALWRGGWAEKSAAAIIVVAWFLTPLLQHHYAPGIAFITLDGVTALALFAISAACRRLWALFTSSSMIGAFLCHFLVEALRHIGFFSYITTIELLGGAYLVAGLAAGIVENEYLRGRRKQDVKSAS